MTRNQTRNSKPAREYRPPAFIAWHVDEKGEKKFWTRIGAAWDHKDGEGFTLQLDLVPVNGGRIILRTPREDEEDQAEADGTEVAQTETDQTEADLTGDDQAEADQPQTEQEAGA